MMYVAYGSNMNLKQMERRCPKSEIICNGELIGWKLVFNIHADVLHTYNEEDVVPVVVWNIHDDDWYILDRYEGYPTYYVKETVPVVLSNGEVINAIVYVMAEDRKGICRPCSSYFETIENGYNDNGINVDTLYDALEYSMCNETLYNQYNTRSD